MVLNLTNVKTFPFRPGLRWKKIGKLLRLKTISIEIIIIIGKKNIINTKERDKSKILLINLLYILFSIIQAAVDSVWLPSGYCRLDIYWNHKKNKQDKDE